MFEALSAQVAQHFPKWSGLGWAMQADQTRSLDLIEHIIGLARKYKNRLVGRLLENGANSSFVHQLAGESVGMDELLIAPLRLTSECALPLPIDLFGTDCQNSTDQDLAVQPMRDPLLAADKTVPLPMVPVFDVKSTASALSISVSSYKKCSKKAVEETHDCTAPRRQ